MVLSSELASESEPEPEPEEPHACNTMNSAAMAVERVARTKCFFRYKSFAMTHLPNNAII